MNTNTEAKVKVPKSKRKSDGRERQREYLRLRRLKVIEGYGGKCVCCGEDRWEFLTIDHIHSDGAEDRAETGRFSNKLYLWLIKNEYPTDRFQLLCYNCNCARFQNGGICPHIQRAPLPRPVNKRAKFAPILTLTCAICKETFTRKASRVHTELNRQTCSNSCKTKLLHAERWTVERRAIQSEKMRSDPEKRLKAQDAAKEWRLNNREKTSEMARKAGAKGLETRWGTTPSAASTN